MPIQLEGGCFVAGLMEGDPEQHGCLRIWCHVGRARGAEAISLRVLQCEPGTSPGLMNPECDEVVFVLEGDGMLYLDGHAIPAAPETGVFVAPGVRLTLHNAGPGSLVLLSSRCPEPEEPFEVVEPLTTPTGPPPWEVLPVARLAERPAETTGDRWYKVLVGSDLGSHAVTQFVGAIPPGRAPGHFHNYEEVICILHGSGNMWAAETSTPVEPGSCIFLPRKQVHCLENTGDGELRLLGVFYPAGSPAASYED